MPSLHPFVTLFDRVAALTLTPPEKAVLWTVARHSDWSTGTGSFAHHRRLATEAGLGLSTVRRVLAGLACTGGVSGQCFGHASRCLHRGLLDIDYDATTGRFSWTLRLEERALQAHLPEIVPPLPVDMSLADQRSG